MSEQRSLWRVIRPLQEGATAGWMRLYYGHLYDMSFNVRTVEDVAKTAIRYAYATFRAEYVAVVLLQGDRWHVLPYRQNDTLAESLWIPSAATDADPLYEAGQIVEIADLPAFATKFARVQPVVDRGVCSVVAAAFGSQVQGRGYLAFAASGPQHYSDDEYVLMCLHALAAGIGFAHVGKTTV